ncbi:MAG: bifunctional 3-(3-hydroxy-phenyl)propionate/3-hydroxycinnamic acid hydroxylase [Myxococcota bacterium]
MDVDVVICGYGPSGAVAANLLGQRGVRTLVIDKSEDIYDIPRAVHFDGEVMRIFQALGMSDEIRQVSGTAERLGFVNGRGWTLLSIDVTKEPRRHGWPIGNFFNQPLLERHLRAGVARFPSVEVRLGWELRDLAQDDDGVTLRVAPSAAGGGAEETVRARYVLGADGASSRVRECGAFRLEDLQCDEPWLVCDLILEEGTPIERTAVQICDPVRPTTLVPCEGTHIRWEFMLRPGDDPAHLEDEATARAMMAPHMDRIQPGLSSEQGKLVRTKVYTFHGLVADTFRDRRLLLLGDAAHQTPPFLGQGLCAGVRDAHNLCWKLEGVLAGRFDASVLDTYTSERRPHARRIVKEAIRAGGIIQTTNRLRAFLRDAVFLLGRVFPPLRQRDMQWAPAWATGPGLFDAAEKPTPESAHGHVIDQPELLRSSGERVPLDDEIGERFALIGVGVDPATLLDAEATRVADVLGMVRLHVAPDGPLRDVDGGLADWAARHGDARVVLVRPDRQVYGVWSGDDAALGARVAAALRALDDRLLGKA